MMDVRTEIAAVDWRSLEAKGGSAAQVGDALLGLWSDNEEDILRHFRVLRDVLWANDAFFPAGATAFPLLLRAAADRSLLLRQAPLKLAANILAAGYLSRQTAGLDASDVLIRQRYSEGLARAIYQHALSQYDALVALVNDDNDDVVAHGALLLAMLSERREPSIRHLRARASGPEDEESRAAILYALGLLLRYEGSPNLTVTTLEPLEAQSRGTFERAVAHAARYLTAGVAVHPEAGKRLTPLVRRGEGSTRTFPWADDYAPRLAVDPLLVQGQVGFDAAASMLLYLVRAREGGDDALYEYLLLHFVRHRELGRPGPPPVYLPPESIRAGKRSSDALSLHERRSLLAIANLPLTSPAFDAFGLPNEASQRRSLLGLETSSNHPQTPYSIPASQVARSPSTPERQATAPKRGRAQTSRLPSGLALLRSFSRWRHAEREERTRCLRDLDQRLGEPWARSAKVVGRYELGEFVYRATGDRFIAVPGGQLRMGLSADDIYAAYRARRSQRYELSWDPAIVRSRPAHIARIAPFLIARTPTLRTGILPGDAPMRVASEAELEWVLREGGRARWVGLRPRVVLTSKNRLRVLARDTTSREGNGFGVHGLHERVVACADDWHPNYQGAPSDGRSWGTGGRVVRYGHAAWQDADEELFGLLAAARQENQSLAEGILLAFSLPGFAPSAHATKCLAQHTRTLRALREGSSREQRAALHALCSFVATGGEDVDELVTALHTKPA